MHLPATEADPRELTSGGSLLIRIPAAGQQDFPGREDEGGSCGNSSSLIFALL